MMALRFTRAERPDSDLWRSMPIEPATATLLGISFRARQAEALKLDPRACLPTLLAYPFPLVRLGAYWNRIEPNAGHYTFDDLDWQVDAAERAGKRIILDVGAVKAFSYPEFYAPAHALKTPLREGALVRPETHPALLSAAMRFVTQIVERYKSRQAVIAWQVEHEAVDPLGVEHSWRLAAAFVRAEVEAVRAADPARPIMLNGFLPTSQPARAQQWWSTRDQGDSLAVAEQLADIVGVDYYPRHALARIGAHTLYLDGVGARWPWRRLSHLRAWAAAPASAHARRVMISEGQAEPWEAVTTPPNPSRQRMFSCQPEQLIANYNTCLRWAQADGIDLFAYLFWGAEYWLLRQQSGDDSYLRAFERVLEVAGG